MVSRSGGPSTFTPSNDNRLDQQREQQIKQLQESQAVHSRDEAERVVDSVMRRLQQANAGQRVPGISPDDQATRTRAADPGSAQGQQQQGARPPRAPDAPLRGAQQGGQAPTATAPATSNPATATTQPATTSPSTTTTSPARNPDLGRLIADFQRQNGLPVTGKLDPGTVNTMKETGVITPSSSQPSTTTQAGARESGPPKSAPRPEDTAAARQARSAVDQQARARVDGSAPTRDPQSSRDAGRARENAAPSTARASAGQAPPNQADRVPDPSRLLASLFTAGFAGKKGSLEEALKSFQATFGLPMTGKADPATVDALAQHGVIESEAPKKTQTDKPVEAKQQVRRALNDASPTSKTAADKDVTKDPIRPQAPTQKPTTSSDVAARAPVTAASPDASLEKARLDTVLASQAAVERGVQEGKGDPHAAQGHGDVKGEGAGQKGQGGVTGGGTVEGAGPAGTAAPDGEDAAEGTETATGNSKAGDDEYGDDERGNANVKGEDEDGNLLPGFWRVPLLSEQVRAAMNVITRDDDGSGPVTYTWDVTFHRPGVYADGQPAEELWHVVVHRATAFDAVWQTAADAIASRMLYAEPDGTPPTIDDFVRALRRARVR